MKQNIVLYRTLSMFAILKLWFARVVLLALIISGLLHIEENPLVISIIVGFLTVLLLSVGNHNIIVYNNRFVYLYGSLLKLLTRRTTYYYEELEQVTCEGIFTKSLDVIAEKIPIAIDPINRIDIYFQNGQREQIDLYIYRGELKKAIEQINLHLNKVKS